MGLPLLVAFALAAAPTPPVPSDCRIEQVHDAGHRLHLTLDFVETRCAGERVAYLCTDQRCVKDPCGGYDAEAATFLAVGTPARGSRSSHSKSRRSHGSHGSKSSHRSKSSHGHGSSSGGSGEITALLLRGPEHTLQVVTLSANGGTPGCRPVKGLDQVLVDAINKRVKIGETLGRSGERDELHGQSLVLTRGLYAGGDEPGAPSHGYLRIRAKISRGKLKMTSASRISQDKARFGRP